MIKNWFYWKISIVPNLSVQEETSWFSFFVEVIFLFFSFKDTEFLFFAKGHFINLFLYDLDQIFWFICIYKEAG